MILSALVVQLINFADTVKKYYGLINEVSIKKLISYYHGEDIKQLHNALDDAQYLKEIYEHITTEDAPEESPFKEAIRVSTNELKSDDIYFIDRCSLKGSLWETYKNIDEALDWIIQTQLSAKDRKTTNRENVKKKLITAINKNTSYFNYIWKLKKVIN